jgi:hypothetical protein
MKEMKIWKVFSDDFAKFVETELAKEIATLVDCTLTHLVTAKKTRFIFYKNNSKMLSLLNRHLNQLQICFHYTLSLLRRLKPRFVTA